MTEPRVGMRLCAPCMSGLTRANLGRLSLVHSRPGTCSACGATGRLIRIAAVGLAPPAQRKPKSYRRRPK